MVGVFEGSGVRRAIFPSTLVTIGARAFRGCKALCGVRLTPGVKVLGDECFSGSGLTAIELPKSVTMVQLRAFADCADLAEAAFEQGTALEYVDNEAFAGTQVDVGALPAFVRARVPEVYGADE